MPDQPAYPHNNCYWVRPGRFLAGGYPATYTVAANEQIFERFLDLGITCFIDLTEPDEPLPPYEGQLAKLAATLGQTARYQRFAIRDRDIPTPELMQSILNTVDQALTDGEGVYLHCWGGIGRTGTVVGCYLVRHGAYPAEALSAISQLRQQVLDVFIPSPETEAQRNFIAAWLVGQ